MPLKSYDRMVKIDENIEKRVSQWNVGIVRLLNTNQIEVLDVDNQQILISTDSGNMENNVTSKRCWHLEFNTSNKYMKFYNVRKV